MSFGIGAFPFGFFTTVFNTNDTFHRPGTVHTHTHLHTHIHPLSSSLSNAHSLSCRLNKVFLSTDPQFADDLQGNGNPNNGNNNWQDSLFLFVAVFFFLWLLSVWWREGKGRQLEGWNNIGMEKWPREGSHTHTHTHTHTHMPRQTLCLGFIQQSCTSILTRDRKRLGHYFALLQENRFSTRSYLAPPNVCLISREESCLDIVREGTSQSTSPSFLDALVCMHTHSRTHTHYRCTLWVVVLGGGGGAGFNR